MGYILGLDHCKGMYIENIVHGAIFQALFGFAQTSLFFFSQDMIIHDSIEKECASQ